jgi:hypothetical protein
MRAESYELVQSRKAAWDDATSVSPLKESEEEEGGGKEQRVRLEDVCFHSFSHLLSFTTAFERPQTPERAHRLLR